MSHVYLEVAPMSRRAVNNAQSIIKGENRIVNSMRATENPSKLLQSEIREVLGDDRREENAFDQQDHSAEKQQFVENVQVFDSALDIGLNRNKYDGADEKGE